MIEAREIRVGNIFMREVQNERGLEYDPEFVITENWIGKLFSDDDLSIALNDLSPIPLTEELFVRLGGRTVSEGIFEIHGVLLAYLTSDECFQVEYFGCSSKNRWEITNIKHVHSLQNLIFALTNSELKLIK